MSKNNIIYFYLINNISMDKEQSNGQIVLNMRELTMKERNMVKAHYYLQMDQNILEILITMIYMVKEFIFGLIIENMKEIGVKIKCMVKEKQGIFFNYFFKCLYIIQVYLI